MTSPRGFARIIAIIIALAGIVAVIWYWNHRQIPQQTQIGGQDTENTQNSAGAPAQSPCGLTIASPLPSSNVTVPFAVTGTVYTHPSLACHWTLFEGQAGTIEIRNAVTNAVVMNKIPLGQLPMNWMDLAVAGQPVDFSITVSALDVAYTGPALLIFEEDNPSGEGIPDTLLLNVNIQ